MLGKQKAREIWLEALRSGRYKQAGGALEKGLGNNLLHHCCLGVVQRELEPLIPELTSKRNEDCWNTCFYWKGGEATTGNLVSGVFELLGLTHETVDKLIIMNDREKKSFTEIADWLEALWAKEAQDLWLSELESGRWKQARYVLEELDSEGKVIGNCCLGVACRLYMQEGGELDVKPVHDGVGIVTRKTDFDGTTSNLPEKVANWLKLPESLSGGQNVQLVRMNDRRNLTFPEIAAEVRLALAGGKNE